MAQCHTGLLGADSAGPDQRDVKLARCRRQGHKRTPMSQGRSPRRGRPSPESAKVAYAPEPGVAGSVPAGRAISSRSILET
jgi:hypothetical protein